MAFGASLGCVGRLVRAVQPIPDKPRPAETPRQRGSERDAAMISSAQRLEIYRELVRTFFRPTRGQARWIDPQPLSHRREQASDSLALEDDDWADAIVRTIGLRRVCALDGPDDDCRGRPGGILRLSAPYTTSAGTDAVIVFVRYSIVSAGEPAAPGEGFEMEFRLARRDDAWRIVSKRTIAGLVDFR
jgi:hypothetical protein